MILRSIRLATAIIGLFAVLLSTRTAVAEDPLKKRHLEITISDDRLMVTFGYEDAFTSDIRKKLGSGLPTRLLIQINLEKLGTNKPLGFWAREVNLVYDLWEEVYVVTMSDDRGRRQARVPTIKEAISLAGMLTRQEVARLKGLDPGTYRLRVLVEVNPVSKKMVERIRRWLSRSPGSQSSSAGSSNFFGSFVSIFVDRRIGEADFSSAFVSQDFKLEGP